MSRSTPGERLPPLVHARSFTRDRLSPEARLLKARGRWKSPPSAITIKGASLSILKCQRTTWINQGPWSRAEVYVCLYTSSLPPICQRRVEKPAYGEVIKPQQNELANTPHANSQGSQRSPRTCGVLGHVGKMHYRYALGGTECGVSRSLLLKSSPDAGVG